MCSQEHYMEHYFKVSWSIKCVRAIYWWGHCRFVPTTVLRIRYGDKQWFDASCQRAYDVKLTAYLAWCRARSAHHWGRFVVAHVEAQRVYGAGREFHNESTRNTLKQYTYSHKWWETLKSSIFGVKQSIPALRRLGAGLVVAPAEKASRLGYRFDSKECREQFVTPLSCFPQAVGKIILPSGLQSFCSCFLILTHKVVLISWVCFLFSEKAVANIIAPKTKHIFSSTSPPQWLGNQAVLDVC